MLHYCHSDQMQKCMSRGGLHKGRGEDGHGVPSMHQAQGCAHQGVEGPLEGLVTHPGAAKGDAPDVSLWVLQRSPCCTCTHHHTASAMTLLWAATAVPK